MDNKTKDPKIKVMADGPYIVSGHVPLLEKMIVPRGREYRLIGGQELPQAETYALCRCGQSKKKPFCDGSHVQAGFIGNETACLDKYVDRAELISGPGVDMRDDNRCALGRFCHREGGKAWELVARSDDPVNREEAVIAAVECPAGRLEVMDKAGQVIEPTYEPSIAVIQDTEHGVSAGLYLRGNIPMEGAEGQIYEVRNRAALCRCGQSRNKPFCDAMHEVTRFSDDE